MDDLEERLRDDLRQPASREEPPTDAWDRITERLQREDRRPTASPVLVGALVLAITAGGLVWLWHSFVSTGDGSPAGQPEDLWRRTFLSTWVIEEGEPRTLVDGTQISMTFFVERNRRGLRWEAGCNFFGTGLEITADSLIVQDQIDGSDQGCARELHDQDDWLADFLASDPSWELRGDRLTLTSGGTTIELEAAPGADPDDLWGRTFVSTRVIEEGEPRTLIEGTRIGLTFFVERERRGLRWDAHCNIFGASVVITADRLILGEIGGTQKGGSPECQEQDEWLADFLDSEPTWELRGDMLTLSSGQTIIELEGVTSSNGLECLGDEGMVQVIYESSEPAGADLPEAVEAAFQLPPAMADAQRSISESPDEATAEVLYRFEQRRVARVSFSRIQRGWAMTGYTACDSALNTAPGS